MKNKQVLYIIVFVCVALTAVLSVSVENWRNQNNTSNNYLQKQFGRDEEPHLRYKETLFETIIDEKYHIVFYRTDTDGHYGAVVYREGLSIAQNSIVAKTWPNDCHYPTWDDAAVKSLSIPDIGVLFFSITKVSDFKNVWDLYENKGYVDDLTEKIIKIPISKDEILAYFIDIFPPPLN